MKALVLAAGYGTRLARGIEADTTGAFEHLKGVPKPLLPIGGVPLITRWMDQLKEYPAVDTVYVVTNAYNFEMFTEWAKAFGNVELVSDGSTSNDNRIGAVGAIQLAVEYFKIADDLLIIGGDTLFLDDFSLAATLGQFTADHRSSADTSMVLCYDTDDTGASKCGILEIDEARKVTAFLEKPGPENTKSRSACPCFYLFSPAGQTLLAQFLEERKDRPLAERDAPGNFVRYLTEKADVKAMQISGRFDVGNLESYKVCDDYFHAKAKAAK